MVNSQLCANYVHKGMIQPNSHCNKCQSSEWYPSFPHHSHSKPDFRGRGEIQSQNFGRSPPIYHKPIPSSSYGGRGVVVHPHCNCVDGDLLCSDYCPPLPHHTNLKPSCGDVHPRCPLGPPRGGNVPHQGQKVQIPHSMFFDGTGNWEAFKFKFCIFLAKYDLHDFHNAQYFFLMALRGEAENYFSQAKNTVDFADMAEIFTFMTNRYGQKAIHQAAVARFNTIEQAKEESSQAWLGRVWTAAYHAFPDLPSEYVEPYVVARFISGLWDRDAVQYLTCQDLELGTMSQVLDKLDLYDHSRHLGCRVIHRAHKVEHGHEEKPSGPSWDGFRPGCESKQHGGWRGNDSNRWSDERPKTNYEGTGEDHNHSQSYEHLKCHSPPTYKGHDPTNRWSGERPKPNYGGTGEDHNQSLNYEHLKCHSPPTYQKSKPLVSMSSTEQKTPAAHGSKVNIFTATLEELSQVRGVTAETAFKIITLREADWENGKQISYELLSSLWMDIDFLEFDFTKPHLHKSDTSPKQTNQNVEFHESTQGMKTTVTLTNNSHDNLTHAGFNVVETPHLDSSLWVAESATNQQNEPTKANLHLNNPHHSYRDSDLALEDSQSALSSAGLEVFLVTYGSHTPGYSRWADSFIHQISDKEKKKALSFQRLVWDPDIFFLSIGVAAETTTHYYPLVLGIRW